MMVIGGVNRVSYGVQAFNDALLKQNGRHHTSQQAIGRSIGAIIWNFICFHRSYLWPHGTKQKLVDTMTQPFNLARTFV